MCTTVTAGAALPDDLPDDLSHDLSNLDHLSDVDVDARAGAADRGDRAAADKLIAELDGVWPPAGMVEATEAGPVLAALLNTVSLPPEFRR